MYTLCPTLVQVMLMGDEMEGRFVRKIAKYINIRLNLIFMQKELKRGEKNVRK